MNQFLFYLYLDLLKLLRFINSCLLFLYIANVIKRNEMDRLASDDAGFCQAQISSKKSCLADEL